VPSVRPSKAPSQAAAPCDGVYVEIDVLTDWYPEETNWTLFDNCGLGIVKSRGDFENDFNLYKDSYCLPSLPYTFTIFDSYGDGFCCGGYYTVRYDGVEVVSGVDFDYDDTIQIGVNKECPTNAPTISEAPSAIPSTSVAPSFSAAPSVSPTFKPSKAPSQAAAPCDGVYVEIDVLTDWYPEETNWTLFDNCGLGIVKNQGDFENDFNLYRDSFCIPSLPYTFTIFDSFGDGICCGGNYAVRYDEVEVVFGGEFNYTDSTQINLNQECPTNASSTSAAPSISPVSSTIHSPLPSLVPSLSTSLSLPQVRMVKVVSGTGRPIQMFEFRVFSFGKNVALGKLATQSSNYKELNMFGAGKAVDGDPTSFSHTQRIMDGSWWEVDLEEMIPIESISIVNRWCRSIDDPANCLCRLSYSTLYLWDNERNLVAAQVIGNTCGAKEVNFTFPPLTNFNLA